MVVLSFPGSSWSYYPHRGMRNCQCKYYTHGSHFTPQYYSELSLLKNIYKMTTKCLQPCEAHPICQWYETAKYVDHFLQFGSNFTQQKGTEFKYLSIASLRLGGYTEASWRILCESVVFHSKDTSSLLTNAMCHLKLFLHLEIRPQLPLI